MSDLYPRFDMPDIVGATENTVVAFPKSWLWDWDICDFVQTGSGDVVEVDGFDSLGAMVCKSDIDTEAGICCVRLGLWCRH